MGLISDLGYEKVNEILGRMIPEAHRMGIPDGFDPFITLSFMALPVIPEIRVTPERNLSGKRGQAFKRSLRKINNIQKGRVNFTLPFLM